MIQEKSSTRYSGKEEVAKWDIGLFGMKLFGKQVIWHEVLHFVFGQNDFLRLAAQKTDHNVHVQFNVNRNIKV